MPGVPRDDITRHATAIRAALPVPADYPAKGRAWPEKRVANLLHRAGWPVETVTALVPQREHRGPRTGQQTRDAPQPVAVVPLAWLEELARRCGCDLADVCRGLIPDE